MRFTAKSRLAVVLCLGTLGLMAYGALDGSRTAGQQPPAVRPAAPALPPAPAESVEDRVAELLASRTDFAFVDRPLQEVADWAATRLGINVMIDTGALQAEGLPADGRVSLSLRDVKMESALNLALRQQGLTWIIRDEVMLFTTVDAADEFLQIKVYDVHDLVDRPRGELALLEADPITNLDNLEDAIKTTIEPTSWDDEGGSGSIKALPDRRVLVIRQTQGTHRLLAEFLAALRAVLQAMVAADPENAVGKQPPDENLYLAVYRVAPGYPVVQHGGFFRVNAQLPKEVLGQAAAPAAPIVPGAAQQPLTVSYPTADELARVVEEVIEPKSWQQAGGQGVIRAVKGALVVKQTAAVHKQIRALLKALRVLETDSQTPLVTSPIPVVGQAPDKAPAK